MHLKDLVGHDGAAAAVARPPLILPESLPVLDAMRALQGQRRHLAVVVDEHGGGAGVLSLEDVLEELVGEIYDEFDRDIAAVAVTEDGALLLDGTFPVHDLPDLHVALPEDAAGSYTTVAGLLLARLGHLPAPGEGVDLPGWRLEAVEVSDRAVQRLRLVRIPG